jgi:hypothetical protein
MVGHDRGTVTPAQVPQAVRDLGERLDELGWVTELLVAGSWPPGITSPVSVISTWSP